jgi:hypothetical protein
MVDESTDRTARTDFFKQCGFFPLMTPEAPLNLDPPI